ncbi:MAG: hypothetical protein IJH12_10770 [Clostridia bacterium]|nr:hypothetical protein [Clostridia bacterium]
MTCDEFTNIYWNNYILIEKEFRETSKYVTLSDDNYDTYSTEYIKLLLQIGSEVDVLLKDFCSYIDKSFCGENMNEYRDCISTSYKDLFQQKVRVIHMKKDIEPWDAMLKQQPIGWWTAYNKVKHERNQTNTIDGITKTSYKFANLRNTLMALGGLYQILLNYYLMLAQHENKHVLIPLPGSRIFKLIGNKWKSVNFVLDTAIYLDADNGCLYMESSEIDY